MSASAATPNVPEAAATSDVLAAAGTSNEGLIENPGLPLCFAYSNKILTADKKLSWYQHENIPPNVIGTFKNYLMYGDVVSVPHPSANKF